LIERYLRGELSPAEEEHFFIEIATNAELRQELKAYRIVDETLTTDSARHAVPQTALRRHLEQQMAGHSAISDVPQDTTLSGTTQSLVRTWWFMAAVVILLIGGFVVFTLPQYRTPLESQQPVPVSTTPVRVQDIPTPQPSGDDSLSTSSRNNSSRDIPSSGIPIPSASAQHLHKDTVANNSLSARHQNSTEQTAISTEAHPPPTSSTSGVTMKDTSSPEATMPIQINRPRKLDSNK
jgi:hypothetical protein